VIRYVLRRLLQAGVVAFFVTVIAFGSLWLTGDPTSAILAGQELTPEAVELFRRQMGFDRPLHEQYLDYLGGVLQGDLGVSLLQGVDNARLIAQTLPATIQLTIASTIITLLVGIPIGVISALKRNQKTDRAVMLGALVAQSMPEFWLGLVLILVFAVSLHWLPVSGGGGIEYLIMPAITLSVVSIARNARMVRSSLLDVLNEDYIRTARSKGLIERIVLYRHALKNAMLPVLTLIGIDIGYRLGGTIVVETVFAWPGMGRMMFQAIQSKDITLVQGSLVVLAFLVVLVNLVVDLLYMWFDPKVRYR
jgi:peptide/nickel transport system permease protein